MYIKYNPNPEGNRVGDCVIRALSKLLEQDWNTTYIELCLQGYLLKDMPSSNNVWADYLKSKGYTYTVIPNLCPECYSIKEFCEDNKHGRFLIGTGTHAVAVVDGNYYDSWDSGDEVPMYVFLKEE